MNAVSSTSPKAAVWVARGFVIAVSLAAMTWAVTDARFRDSEGALTGAFVFPWACGIALCLAGLSIATAWFRSAVWAALSIVSFAASLLLIDAGPRVHYQHYRPERLTFPVALILGVQIIAVLGSFAARFGTILEWFRSRRLVLRVAMALGIISLFGAAASQSIGFYLGELAFAAVFQVVQIANIFLAVQAIPTGIGARIRRLFDVFSEAAPTTAAERPSRYDGIAIYGAVWVTVVSASLSFFIYEGHPHIPDEVVYVYQARYLAAGLLKMPLPSVPAAFDLDLMNYEAGAWFCPVPPGWPFLLSIGMLAGVPWLVNPVLAGLNTLLSYTLFGNLYSRRIARIAVALLCVSPWHIFMAMNYMTHTFTLTCALAGAVAIARWRRTGSPAWACAAGAAAGIASLIRPLDGLIVFLWLAILGIFLKGKRIQLTGAAAFLAATGLVGALALPYNQIMTGSPFKAPIMAYADKYYGKDSNAMGFGRNRGLGWQLDPFPGHSPLDAAVNTVLNGFSLNNELLGWSIGSLGFLSLLLFARNRERSDWLLISLSALVIGIYCFYWYSGGPDFGARYWFLLLPACIALTARGIQFAASHFSPSDRIRPVVAAAFLCVVTVFIYLPWRAVDKYWHYLFMRRGVQQVIRDCHGGRTLVLVRGLRFPDYSSAAVYNPIRLDANGPIYAWDKDTAVRRQVLEAYSDRTVCVVEGPTVTGHGYRLIAGPLPAGSFVAATALNRTATQNPAP